MPFTREQFFEVFVAWNLAFPPLAIFAYLLGIAAVILLFRPSRVATAALLGILSLMWLANGAGYHLGYFTRINPAAWIFGAVFIVEAVLLAVTPFVAPGFRISAAADVRTLAGGLLVAFAMVVYPLLGLALGHVWPAMPVFGTAPCPTTIFTIGILLLGEWRVVRWLLAIPALWGVVGGSATLLLGVPQDLGLIVSTLVVVALALGRSLGAGFARHENAA